MRFIYSLQRTRVTGLAIALLFASVITGSSANAVGAESITLSPTTQRYSFDAGDVITDEIIIVNDGDTAYDVLIYAEPYGINDTTDDPTYAGTTNANADLYEWVQIPKTRWHIEAGKTVNIPYVIRSSATAAPGGHYGVIFAEIQPEDGDTGVSVARKKRVGTVVYAKVAGNIIESGSVTSMTLDNYQTQAPLVASADVKNAGNVDFLAKVTMTIRDVFGNVKHKGVIERNVLPGITLTMDAAWDKPTWIGLYKVQVSSEVLDKTESKDAYVLLAPVWFIFTVVAIALAGVVYALRRPRKSSTRR